MEIDKSKMKDSQGRFMTQALFLETSYGNDGNAIFTLKDDDYMTEDGRLLISLKKLFLDSNDPTGWEVANKYLAGPAHWVRLTKNQAINKHIEQWKVELDWKLSWMGIKQMIDKGKNGDSVVASKWLADKGYKDKVPGRPKSDSHDDTDILDKDYKSDLERLKLVK